MRSAIKYRALRLPRREDQGRRRRARTTLRRLRWFRRILGPWVDLRLDANEAWPAAELLERVEPLRRFSLSVLEQPVPHAEVDGPGRPAAAARRAGDARRIALRLSRRRLRGRAHATADMLNVRLSKCGGILPSLRIIGLAQRSGLGVQLGCHPGETAILSAAGRHVASRVQGLS